MKTVHKNLTLEKFLEFATKIQIKHIIPNEIKKCSKTLLLRLPVISKNFNMIND